MTSGGNNFNHFAENQLTKFSARDAAGEREMAPKCGSLPQDAGDLVGLHSYEIVLAVRSAGKNHGCSHTVCQCSRLFARACSKMQRHRQRGG